MLPFTSVTVNVTVLTPRSAHPKALLLRARPATPQLSEDPKSTAAAVMEALPLASS